MATLVSRGLSLAVYAAYLVAAFTHLGGEATARLAAGLLLPLACIWFPEALGGKITEISKLRLTISDIVIRAN
jgi:hypothetical protein